MVKELNNSEDFVKRANGDEILIIKNRYQSISHKFIFAIIIIFTLFLEAIYIVTSSLWKGFLKRETLSQRTDLGFDFEIFIK